MKTLIQNEKSLFIVILYSFSYWILGIGQTLVFFHALEIDVPLLFTMVNIPIAIFIGMLPVTVAGVGTRDVTIVFILYEFTSAEKLLGVVILFSVFKY